jgi:hypothetical protein
MIVPRWTSSTTPGSLLRADIGIPALSQKLLAVVGGVDLGELHLVFGQFVRGEDGSGFADGGTGPTIQTPLRVDEELLEAVYGPFALSGVNVLALAGLRAFIVYCAEVGDYVWHKGVLSMK